MSQSQTLDPKQHALDGLSPEDLSWWSGSDCIHAQNNTSPGNRARRIRRRVVVTLLAAGAAVAFSDLATAASGTFSSSARITIPDSGAGTPYPSTINVSGLAGTISGVTLTLNRLGHTFPGVVDILLVGPGGQKVMVFSDVGGSANVNNITVTLSDAASSSLPINGPLVSGTFKPTDASPGEAQDLFPAPAPAGPYPSTLATFNGLVPNGLWSLYVNSDGTGGSGKILNGWSLTVTTASAPNTPPTISDIPNQTITANTSTTSIPFSVGDAETAAGSLTLGKSSSNPTLVPVSNIVFGGSGASRTVTVAPAADQVGTATITVSVSDGTTSVSDSFVLTVNAANPPPAIALTSPTDGAGYTAPATVNLNATVTANGHTITKVQFYNGSALLGEDSTSPYSYAWNNVSAGNYSLTARAVYDAGSTVNSTPVTVAVTNPSGTVPVAFTNSAAIAIPDSGAGTPYPSTINVSGLAGTISGMTLTVIRLAQTYPGDVDILLVGPGGQKVMVLSDVGGSADVNNVTLTLSDAAAASLPINGPLVSGTFKPTDAAPGEPRDLFPAPAPAGPYASALATFNGLAPNGLWSLYVNDDGAGDGGTMAGGWSLSLTTTGSGAGDTIAPTVSLTAPANNAVVSGSPVVVSANASDNVGVVGVQFKVDGVNLGEDATAPYSIFWNSTTVGDGTHLLTGVARDAAGNYATSSVVQVTVSNSADTTSPSVPTGLTVTAVSAWQLNLAWTASSDDVGVAGYRVYRNGSLVNTVAATVYSDTGLLPSSTHSYQLVAVDAAGNVSPASAAVSGTTLPAPSGAATGPLFRLASNPRYFTDGSGKAIYLTGSHTWGNNKDYGVSDPPPALNYTAYLDFLRGHNHNFFRLWTWELPHSEQGLLEQMWWRLPFPWLRTGPGVANDGKPKFDLTQFNQPYFDRLRARVIEAGNRGIYVSVMLWDGYGLQVNSHVADGFPFTSGNNVNGISCGQLDSQRLVNAAVTARQEAYARKVIDSVNDLDNVLYEIVNEAGSYSTSWQYHMIDLIKDYEATKPKQHPVGMTFQYSGGSDSTLYNSQADWISPSHNYPVSDGTKVIINDTDHSYFYTGLIADGQAAHRRWVWKNFASGNNTLFMDPYLVVWPGRNAPNGTITDPYWDVIRKSLGYTKLYADKMNLAAMTPSMQLVSSGDCLAKPGTEYLVYAGSSSFTLTVVTGTYYYEWFNVVTGQIATSGTINISSSNHNFTAPNSNAAVLYLKRQ